jgi:hypothetical protein
MVRVERLSLHRGWNILFYVSKDENLTNPVTVHKYSPSSGRHDETIRALEPGIYAYRIRFNTLGKYVLVFLEDGVKQLISIITVEKDG